MINKKNKLNLLTNLVQKKGADFYLLSTTDEFLNEYVPEENMRLKWLTNFTGSNGYALISKKNSYFFTDGRYILQAKKELDKAFKVIDLNQETVADFIFRNFKKTKILVDTKNFSKNFISNIIKKNLTRKNKIIHDQENLIDSLWINKPQENQKPFFFLQKKFSGLDSYKKIKKLRDSLKNQTLIITSPESICWLLNVRGFDLPHTPLVLSRLIISRKEIIFYVNKKKIPKKVKFNFDLIIKDISDFDKDLSNYKNLKLLIENQVSYYIFNTLNKNNSLDVENDTCKKLKAIKNSAEILCSENAHIQDGLALVKFFYWIEKNIKNKISEFDAAKKLESFRKEGKDFFSLSFPTISATGSNGSIIHYNPKAKSSILKESDLYLCDSGGQYFGGTTDVTRTIFLGRNKPSKNIKNLYTYVLMGHLNISLAKFPFGTKGYQIDAIARYELWKNGFDYNHGTGHGVGSFLGVHEGPQSLSKAVSDISLQPGMIVSNEPGYYRDKEFGIRIENLVLVKKSKIKNFCEFKTLSLFPYEKKLINENLLSNDQIKWINNYHKDVYTKLNPYLEDKYRLWLFNKTKMI